jgi:hypothetical protein
MTGNGGADIFKFDVKISTPTAPVQPPLSIPPSQQGIDRELITVTADAADNGNESLTITYAVNGVASAVLVSNPLINFADANAVGAAIAAAMDAVNGITATVAANVVTVSGDNGNSISLIPTPGQATVGGTTTTLAAVYSNGLDVAQISQLKYDSAVVEGELYTVKTELRGGTTFSANATAPGNAPNGADVANLLAPAINAAAVASANPDPKEVNATVAGTVVTVTDTDPDNGGFTLTTTEKGALEGTGASQMGAPNLTNADLITDFLSGTDKISFGLVGGEAANYRENAGFGDFDLAHAAADVAMDGTVRYYLTSINSTLTDPGVGVLFFDANADGTADGVVALTGITETNFAFTDIIA